MGAIARLGIVFLMLIASFALLEAIYAVWGKLPVLYLTGTAASGSSFVPSIMPPLGVLLFAAFIWLDQKLNLD